MRTLTLCMSIILVNLVCFTPAQAKKTSDYTVYDKEKAITLCLNSEYTTKYLTTPPEKDPYEVCESRFKELETQLDYNAYQTWRQTPFTLTPTKQNQRVEALYNAIMMGQPHEQYSQITGISYKSVK